MPNLPVPGVTTSWGDDLNTAIESLHQTGTHAARPSTDLTTGTLYSCTDHALTYKWNGTTWDTWHTHGPRDFTHAKRTTGDIAINSTTFVNVDTGLDLVMKANAGDVIECGLNAKIKKDAAGNTYAVFDFHTIVGGAPINSVSSDSAASTGLANSMAGWGSASVGIDGGSPPPFSAAGTKRYTLQAGDISSGTVTLRLRAFVGAACTIRGTDPMTYVYATNLGPAL